MSNLEVLDLSTVVERETIRIRTKKNPAGKLYQLVNPVELGAYELATLAARQERFSNLWLSSRKRTAKEDAEVHRTLGEMLKLLVLDIEPAVLNEMEKAKRAELVLHWIRKYVDLRGVTEGEPPAATSPRSTTGGSSRGSKPSTAATRKRGSTSRVSR